MFLSREWSKNNGDDEVLDGSTRDLCMCHAWVFFFEYRNGVWWHRPMMFHCCLFRRMPSTSKVTRLSLIAHYHASYRSIQPFMGNAWGTEWSFFHTGVDEVLVPMNLVPSVKSLSKVNLRVFETVLESDTCNLCSITTNVWIMLAPVEFIYLSLHEPYRLFKVVVTSVWVVFLRRICGRWRVVLLMKVFNSRTTWEAFWKACEVLPAMKMGLLIGANPKSTTGSPCRTPTISDEGSGKGRLRRRGMDSKPLVVFTRHENKWIEE